MSASGPTRDLRRVPRRYPRIVLNAIYALEGLCAGPLHGRRRYAALLARDLRTREVEVPINDLPAALDGLRIAHLSDFHAGPFLDAASLAPVVDRVRALAPDLLCLTGDYITHRADEGVALAAAFAGVAPRLGAFLVFGNHDYRARREGEIAAAFAAQGIRALRNEGCALEVGGARLFVAGIEDVEEGKVIDLDAALAGRRDSDVTLLLAHHPDVADVASGPLAGRRIALQLSGHTHGGQIVLFGRSVFGGSLRSRFGVGLHRVGDGRLHVTSGIGALLLPWRLNAPPEVALLILRRYTTGP